MLLRVIVFFVVLFAIPTGLLYLFAGSMRANVGPLELVVFILVAVPFAWLAQKRLTGSGRAASDGEAKGK